MGQKGWLAPGEGKRAQGAGLIQNGPRTATLALDPRDTRGWGGGACEGTSWGGGSPPAPGSLRVPPPRPAAGPGLVEAGGLSTPPSLPLPPQALACARTSCPPERSGPAGFLGFAGQGYWQSHPVPKALRPRIAPPSCLPGRISCPSLGFESAPPRGPSCPGWSGCGRRRPPGTWSRPRRPAGPGPCRRPGGWGPAPSPCGPAAGPGSGWWWAGWAAGPAGAGLAAVVGSAAASGCGVAGISALPRSWG